MAAVSMDSIQFYHPPSNKSIHANHPRQQYDRHESGAVATFAHLTKDCSHAFAQSIDNSDDDYLPPLEDVSQPCFPTKASVKILKPERNQQHNEEPASDATGTHIEHAILGLEGRPGASQDQPVIVGDDKIDSTDAEMEVESTTSAKIESAEADTTWRGIDSAQDPTFESSVSVDPSALSVWYDIEDGCYFDENELLASLELGGPSCPPTRPVLDNSHSLYHYPRPFADKIDQHESDRNALFSSTVPAAHAVPEPVDHSGDRWINVTVAKLQKEVDLICEDRDGLSVASLSCSPRSPRHSIELSSQPGRRSEERRDASRPNPQTSNVGKERPMHQDAAAVTGEPKETRQREVEGEEAEMMAVVERRKVQGERQQEGGDELDEMAMEEPQEGGGVGSNDENDEEDEDPRPAKRRKLPAVSPKEALELAREQNPKLNIGPPRHCSSSKYMRIEIEDRQSQTEEPRFTDDERRDTLAPSRSPSTTAESVPAAEYEEWPLHGFLKRTRIGRTMMFNLEFHLTHVPEHLEISGLSEGLCSSIETSAEHQTSHSAIAHSKTHHVKSRHPTKRIPWTTEEDETLAKMKEEDGCSWEEISHALPSRTLAAIQIRYSTKLCGTAGSRKRRRP